MIYRIEFTPSARKQFARLPRGIVRRIDAHILALAENPFPAGAKKLIESPGLFRIRVGDYRVVYTVEHHALIILVVRIGHRKEVYRNPSAR